jgi:hypothetical protein
MFEIKYKYVCQCGAKYFGSSDDEEVVCDVLYTWDKKNPQKPGYRIQGCGRTMQLDRNYAPNWSNQTANPSVSLHEDHRWQEYGSFNDHAVPQRGTPAWDKYKREGRIKINPRTGMESLYSKDHKEYIQTIKDLGYQNAYGEGEISKSRQRGEHYKE